MNITQKSIGTFKELWFKEFGENLTDQKAVEYASNLLSTVSSVIEKIPP